MSNEITEPSAPYSVKELTDKVNKYMGLEGARALNTRRTRDYVTRALGKSLGQGKRNPYDENIYYGLLFLLRLRKEAPHLGLQDIGRIVHSIPDEVVKRVAIGEERLEIPQLDDPDDYAQYLSGSNQAADGEMTVIVNPSRGIDASDPPTQASRNKSESIRRDMELPKWTTFSPVKSGVRLQVRGSISVAQRRQLEKLTELAIEIVRSAPQPQQEDIDDKGAKTD
jgi:hypothetical protein